MEEASTRVHKMGKYSRGFCRRCSLANASNHQHVTARRNTKDTTERRHSGAQNYSSKIIFRDHRTAQEESFAPVYNSSTSAADSGHGESGVNCGNYSCEYRVSGKTRTAGKQLGYHEKSTRSRSLAGQNRKVMGLLSRSTSCGDVCCLKYEDDEVSSNTSSGNESDSNEYSSAGNCYECEGEHTLGKHRGVGSMPNLNGLMTKENVKSNQLGLEVMLSLINGPMQSVIDSKDEKIRNLERAVERLECENKQIKHDQKPGDATKIFTLEKTLESCVRQIEQLEEANKTAYEKVKLLEDLRKNDKECIDILRVQTNELEMKLSQSDERVREVEKDGKNQSQRLKQQYDKRVDELEKVLRSKESKLRDYDKIKSRVAKQKLELEDKRNSENELHSKMCEQVLELKRELQLEQAKLSILEREKKSLEESLSQSENLQRQDQKSSYVLQMKIVELQEKLEASDRKNEELVQQLEESNIRGQLLEDRSRQASKSLGRWPNGEKPSKERQSSTPGSDGNHNNKSLNPSRNDLNLEKPGKSTAVLDCHENDVLRERLVELHKFHKKQERIYESDLSSSDEHIENLTCFEEVPVQDTCRTSKRDCNAQIVSTRSILEDGNLDDSSSKVELLLAGDKRRPSSDDSSSTSSSASSSRRGSTESPRLERRQLKVLKVRKVSKENITQFQQNAAYILSLGRHSAVKVVREDPCGSSGTLKSNSNRSQSSSVSLRPSKDHTHKM